MPRKPFQFHGFVGQEDRLSHTLSLLRGAKASGKPFPHTLLHGPSGCGKTMLARGLAAEYGTTCVEANGHDELGTISAKIQKLNTGDLLFIDEAHNLKGDAQEMLFSVIDHLEIPDWASRSAESPQSAIAVKPCSIIVATDQPGKIRDALKKRLARRVWLRPYKPAEMRQIVDRMASQADLLLKAQAANRIAKIADGIPRVARHHIEQLALFYAGNDLDALTLQHIRRYLKSAEIDTDGLGPEHRRYLRTLDRLGKASLDSMALNLHADTRWVHHTIEAPLLRKGLIHRGPGGRQLTASGSDWISKHSKTKKEED